MKTETKLTPVVKQRLSALWSEGRFERIYNITFEGYLALTILLDKCESTEDVKLIEWALPSIKSELADMDAYRQAQAAGAAA
jgi:hypothetical protein